MAIELANHIYRDGEGVPVVLMNAYPVDHRIVGRLRKGARRLCRSGGCAAVPDLGAGYGGLG